ncbi:hypothetical protein IEQ34_015033 [Dendrobium chrysotoxum]|uniref:Uncharacterized protein n=1 Tax=Dendrobium chrysotoxum TaxID=161865 RepID=A0AAV7GKS6_DENCH|nr:hypothetical protein IEQ34_015033 [Dendrobium chrysotoxum]
MRMQSATIPASSLLTSASRDRKRFRNQLIVVDDYPPLELPLRWRDPPPLQWRGPPPDPLSHTQPAAVARSFRPIELPIPCAATPVPSIQPDRAHDLPLLHPKHSTRDSMPGIERDSTLEIAEQSVLGPILYFVAEHKSVEMEREQKIEVSKGQKEKMEKKIENETRRNSSGLPK